MSGYNAEEFSKMANDTLVKMLGSQEAVDRFTSEFYESYGTTVIVSGEPVHKEEPKLSLAEKMERVERRIGFR